MITFKAKDAAGEIINSTLHEFTFPAGEKHIKQTEGRELQPVEIAIFQPSPDSLNNDLITLGMWANLLVSHTANTKSVLIMPYVPGARADRGEPFGLKVYANMINNMFIDQIVIFDPHSQVAPELLHGYENLTVVYPEDYFEQPYIRAIFDSHKYDAIIAPDKGALLRAEGVAKALGIPLITATKTRNEETGKLSNFKIEGLSQNEHYLVVDDICDRGGTFIGLAKAAFLHPDHIDLFVSHGVFSSDALENLPTYFGYIYTTNSYNPARDLNISVLGDYQQFQRFDVIRLLLSKIKY